jgi:hypothetical protein
MLEANHSPVDVNTLVDIPSPLEYLSPNMAGRQQQCGPYGHPILSLTSRTIGPAYHHQRQ